MSVQRLHAFEKTSIQARHTIKRLEAVLANTRTSEFERTIAQKLLDMLKDIRKEIPEEFQDIDLTEKE